MTRRLSYSAVFLIALLLLRPAAAEDEPPRAPQPAATITLEVTYPADLRDGVLRIAQNEGVIALDPASNKGVEPPPLPPVEQPMSVLRPVGAALTHLKGRPLDLDVLGALGDMRVLYTNRIGQMCWLILRPRGEPSEAERQSAMERLAAALTADKAFANTAEKVRVELMKPIERAKDHEKRIRVRFDLPSTAAAAAEPPPASVDGKRIIEQMKNAGNLSGYVERKIRTEHDAEARCRTEIHTALVMCESRDPWHLWSFLADIEARERVTVIEVRYERDGYHLARPATAKDHGGAWVKFAVRHPWISSDGLRGDMERTVAARGMRPPPADQRLRLKCPESQVQTLVRLLSAKGIAVRHEKRLLSPTSPKAVTLAPSAAALFGGFSEALGKEGIDLVDVDGGSSHLTITLQHDLPRDGQDADDEALKAAAEKRLKEAWKSVAAHPFLKVRVGGAQIQDIETSAGEDPKTVRISASIDIDLLETDATARQGPAGAPLEGDPLKGVRALAKGRGLSVLTRGPEERERRFRDGLLRLHADLALTSDELDAAGVHGVLLTLERMPGVSVDAFIWRGSGTLGVTLTWQRRLWTEPR